jgi:hypothetical protein
MGRGCGKVAVNAYVFIGGAEGEEAAPAKASGGMENATNADSLPMTTGCPSA